MDGEREYLVVFTNLTGCAIGISDIMWSVTVAAESEDAAIDLAVTQAREVNEGSGMPPHGIRVSDTELRRLAVVVPDQPCPAN
jgi:hypothetical protein